MSSAAYSLSDLCGLAEVTPRTVRYYVSQGILRSPGSGPGTRYDDGHLARLRLVRHLQRQHLPLAEIRSRLAALTDDEAIAEAEGPAEPPRGSALDYVREALSTRTLGPSAMTRRPGPAVSPAAPPVGAEPVTPGPRRVREERPGLAVPPVRRVESVPAMRSMAAPAFVGLNLDETPGAAERSSVASTPAMAAAPREERSTWERHVLTPDVELHVRRPLSRSQNRAVARLLETAREILEEDQP